MCRYLADWHSIWNFSCKQNHNETFIFSHYLRWVYFLFELLNTTGIYPFTTSK